MSEIRPPSFPRPSSSLSRSLRSRLNCGKNGSKSIEKSSNPQTNCAFGERAFDSDDSEDRSIKTSTFMSFDNSCESIVNHNQIVFDSSLISHASLPVASLKFGMESVIDSLATGGTEFGYLSTVPDDPYSYSFARVPKTLRNNKFVTVSKRGIFNHETNEQIDFERLLHEKEIYLELKEMKVFKYFRLWKSFLLWKKFGSSSRYLKSLSLVASNAWYIDHILVKLFQPLSLSLEKLKRVMVFKLEVDALYDIDAFSMLQNGVLLAAHQIKSSIVAYLYTLAKNIGEEFVVKQLRDMPKAIKLHPTSRSILGESVSDIAEQSVSNLFSVMDNDAVISFTEKSSIRSKCRRFAKFIRTFDFWLRDALYECVESNCFQFLMFCFESSRVLKISPQIPRIMLGCGDTLVCHAFKGLLRIRVQLDLVENHYLLSMAPKQDHVVQTLTKITSDVHDFGIIDTSLLSDPQLVDLLIPIQNELENIVLDDRINDFEGNSIAVITKTFLYLIREDFHCATEMLNEYRRLSEICVDNVKFQKELSVSSYISAEDATKELEKIKNDLSWIESINNVFDIGILRLEFAAATKQVFDQILRSRTMFYRFLPDLYLNYCVKLFDEISRIKNSVTSTPSSLENFVKVVEMFDAAVSSSGDRDQKYSFVLALKDVLVTFQVPTEDILESQHLLLCSTWHETNEALNVFQDTLEERVKIFVAEIKNRYKVFLPKIDLAKQYLLESEILDHRSSPGDILIRIASFLSEMEKVESSLKLLDSYQDILKSRVFHMAPIFDIISRLQFFNSLWEIMDKISDLKKHLYSSHFLDVSVKDLGAQLKYVAKLFSKITSEEKNSLEDWLSQELQELQLLVPLIDSLLSKSLTNDHRAQIVSYLPRDIYNEEDLTVSDVVNCNILGVQDKLLTIFYNSSCQSNLLSNFYQIRSLLSELSFVVECDRENRSLLFIQNFDELFISLDDLELAFESSRRSKFSSTHQEIMTEYGSEFMNVRQFVNDIRRLQDLFLEAKVVFTSARTARYLNAHVKDFKVVDDTWRTLMKVVKSDMKVLSVFNTVGLFDQVSQAVIIGERLHGAFVEYVDEQRKRWPKLYLLPFATIVDIFCTFDPSRTFLKCRSLFPEISALVFDESDSFSLTKVVSGFEEVALLKPISARSSLVDWFRSLENGLMEKLGVDIRELHDYPQPFADTFKSGEFCDQSRLCDIQLNFWQNLNDALSSLNIKTSLNSFRMELRENINTLISLLDPSSRYLFVSTINAISQFLSFEDICLMLEKDGDEITPESSFRLESCMRKIWNPINGSIMVKQLGVSYPYGMKYQGWDRRMVLTPLTERCILSIQMAWHSVHASVPVLCGNSGCGKRETIKYLCRDLGWDMSIHEFHSNATLPSIQDDIVNCIKAAAGSGCWFAFAWNNPDIDPNICKFVSSCISTVLCAIEAQNSTVMLDGYPVTVLKNEKKRTRFVYLTNSSFQNLCDLSFSSTFRSIFRPIDVQQPDLFVVLEMWLRSHGSERSKVIASHLVSFFDLICDQVIEYFSPNSCRNLLLQGVHVLFFDSTRYNSIEQAVFFVMDFVIKHLPPNASVKISPEFVASLVPLTFGSNVKSVSSALVSNERHSFAPMSWNDVSSYSTSKTESIPLLSRSENDIYHAIFPPCVPTTNIVVPKSIVVIGDGSSGKSYSIKNTLNEVKKRHEEMLSKQSNLLCKHVRIRNDFFPCSYPFSQLSEYFTQTLAQCDNLDISIISFDLMDTSRLDSAISLCERTATVLSRSIYSIWETSNSLDLCPSILVAHQIVFFASDISPIRHTIQLLVDDVCERDARLLRPLILDCVDSMLIPFTQMNSVNALGWQVHVNITKMFKMFRILFTSSGMTSSLGTSKWDDNSVKRMFLFSCIWTFGMDFSVSMKSFDLWFKEIFATALSSSEIFPKLIESNDTIFDIALLVRPDPDEVIFLWKKSAQSSETSSDYLSSNVSDWTKICTLNLYFDAPHIIVPSPLMEAIDHIRSAVDSLRDTKSILASSRAINIAIVGPSGSSKSCVMDYLIAGCRQMKPQWILKSFDLDFQSFERNIDILYRQSLPTLYELKYGNRGSVFIEDVAIQHESCFGSCMQWLHELTSNDQKVWSINKSRFQSWKHCQFFISASSGSEKERRNSLFRDFFVFRTDSQNTSSIFSKIFSSWCPSLPLEMYIDLPRFLWELFDSLRKPSLPWKVLSSSTLVNSYSTSPFKLVLQSLNAIRLSMADWTVLTSADTIRVWERLWGDSFLESISWNGNHGNLIQGLVKTTIDKIFQENAFQTPSFRSSVEREIVRRFSDIEAKMTSSSMSTSAISRSGPTTNWAMYPVDNFRDLCLEKCSSVLRSFWGFASIDNDPLFWFDVHRIVSFCSVRLHSHIIPLCFFASRSEDLIGLQIHCACEFLDFNYCRYEYSKLDFSESLSSSIYAQFLLSMDPILRLEAGLEGNYSHDSSQCRKSSVFHVSIALEKQDNLVDLCHSCWVDTFQSFYRRLLPAMETLIKNNQVELVSKLCDKIRNFQKEIVVIVSFRNHCCWSNLINCMKSLSFSGCQNIEYLIFESNLSCSEESLSLFSVPSSMSSVITTLFDQLLPFHLSFLKSDIFLPISVDSSEYSFQSIVLFDKFHRLLSNQSPKVIQIINSLQGSKNCCSIADIVGADLEVGEHAKHEQFTAVVAFLCVVMARYWFYGSRDDESSLVENVKKVVSHSFASFSIQLVGVNRCRSIFHALSILLLLETATTSSNENKNKTLDSLLTLILLSPLNSELRSFFCSSTFSFLLDGSAVLCVDFNSSFSALMKIILNRFLLPFELRDVNNLSLLNIAPSLTKTSNITVVGVSNISILMEESFLFSLILCDSFRRSEPMANLSSIEMFLPSSETQERSSLWTTLEAGSLPPNFFSLIEDFVEDLRRKLGSCISLLSIFVKKLQCSVGQFSHYIDLFWTSLIDDVKDHAMSSFSASTWKQMLKSIIFSYFFVPRCHVSDEIYLGSLLFCYFGGVTSFSMASSLLIDKMIGTLVKHSSVCGIISSNKKNRVRGVSFDDDDGDNHSNSSGGEGDIIQISRASRSQMRHSIQLLHDLSNFPSSILSHPLVSCSPQLFMKSFEDSAQELCDWVESRDLDFEIPLDVAQELSDAEKILIFAVLKPWQLEHCLLSIVSNIVNSSSFNDMMIERASSKYCWNRWAARSPYCDVIWNVSRKLLITQPPNSSTDRYLLYYLSQPFLGYSEIATDRFHLLRDHLHHNVKPFFPGILIHSDLSSIDDNTVDDNSSNNSNNSHIKRGKGQKNDINYDISLVMEANDDIVSDEVVTSSCACTMISELATPSKLSLVFPKSTGHSIHGFRLAKEIEDLHCVLRSYFTNIDPDSDTIRSRIGWLLILCHVSMSLRIYAPSLRYLGQESFLWAFNYFDSLITRMASSLPNSRDAIMSISPEYLVEVAVNVFYWDSSRYDLIKSLLLSYFTEGSLDITVPYYIQGAVQIPSSLNHSLESYSKFYDQLSELLEKDQSWVDIIGADPMESNQYAIENLRSFWRRNHQRSIFDRRYADRIISVSIMDTLEDLVIWYQKIVDGLPPAIDIDLMEWQDRLAAISPKVAKKSTDLISRKKGHTHKVAVTRSRDMDPLLAYLVTEVSGFNETLGKFVSNLKSTIDVVTEFMNSCNFDIDLISTFSSNCFQASLEALHLLRKNLVPNEWLFLSRNSRPKTLSAFEDDKQCAIPLEEWLHQFHDKRKMLCGWLSSGYCTEVHLELLDHPDLLLESLKISFASKNEYNIDSLNLQVTLIDPQFMTSVAFEEIAQSFYGCIFVSSPVILYNGIYEFDNFSLEYPPHHYSSSYCQEVLIQVSVHMDFSKNDEDYQCPLFVCSNFPFGKLNSPFFSKPLFEVPLATTEDTIDCKMQDIKLLSACKWKL